MATFRKLGPIVEAITFNELIEFGKNTNSLEENPENWSFDYHGYLVKYKNETVFIIKDRWDDLKFTPRDVLILDIQNNISVQNKLDFYKEHYLT